MLAEPYLFLNLYIKLVTCFDTPLTLLNLKSGWLCLRNAAGYRDDGVPVGVMARARRFAIVQLAREDNAEQEPFLLVQ